MTDLPPTLAVAVALIVPAMLVVIVRVILPVRGEARALRRTHRPQ